MLPTFLSRTHGGPRRHARAVRSRSRPRLEPLEDRALLALITVLNTADDGPGSLRDAIVQASTQPGPDTIAFAPTVTGTITLNSVLPDLSTALTIDGPGASVLIVARSAAVGTPDFGIFTVAAGATVEISGLTITGGSSYHGGGGIYNNGTLTVTSSTISGNWAREDSGTIWGSGTVTGSSISGNAARWPTGSVGGGILNGGMLTVTSSTISGNSAFFGAGGGIFNFGTLTVTSSTISGNFANSGHGGGIDNGGTLTVTSSTISGNSADFGLGGGISNRGTLAVTSSTISGSAAYNVFPGPDGLIYTDGGGGIFNFNTGKLTVTTSLFANSSGGNLLAETGALIVSHGHNLFSNTPSIPLDTTDLVNTDPLLGPLADNGGPTFTCALLPGSPAIDAGVAVAGVTTDQRGVPLPQGSAPDIGAFESRGFTIAMVQGNNQQAPMGTRFALPLVVRVTSPYGEPVAGGQVVFHAATTGPTTFLSGNPATIGANGLASVTATALAGGTGSVTAGDRGAAGSPSFTLTNLGQITAQGRLLTAPRLVLSSHAVATFRVWKLPKGTARPSATTFQAQVNWGDGTSSAGQVKLLACGTYQVIATHGYQKPGTYHTTIQILAGSAGFVLSVVRGKVVARGKG